MSRYEEDSKFYKGKNIYLTPYEITYLIDKIETDTSNDFEDLTEEDYNMMNNLKRKVSE